MGIITEVRKNRPILRSIFYSPFFCSENPFSVTLLLFDKTTNKKKIIMHVCDLCTVIRKYRAPTQGSVINCFLYQSFCIASSLGWLIMTIFTPSSLMHSKCAARKQSIIFLKKYNCAANLFRAFFSCRPQSLDIFTILLTVDIKCRYQIAKSC